MVACMNRLLKSRGHTLVHYARNFPPVLAAWRRGDLKIDCLVPRLLMSERPEWTNALGDLTNPSGSHARLQESEDP
jgi:hypothetical protein